MRRSRLAPHTIDGETELVLIHEDIEVPRPPRDWDRTVRSGITVAAVALVVVSLVWSTASIGDLLAAAVVAPAAYGAAAAFDLAWVLCMAAEWLCRYDRRRGRLPRWAGHLALLVAMGAIYAHGHALGLPVVGVVGAVVSGIAKGAWTVVMIVQARPLDARTQQWYEQRRAKLDGRLAMIPLQRELQRGEALIEAEAAALSANSESGGASTAHHDAHPDASGASGDADDAPGDAENVVSIPRDVTKTAAIMAADSALGGDAPPAKIAHLLAQQGLAVDTAYVRTVQSREARKTARGSGGT
ncbi:protein transporter Sec31 [Streptomyces sp. WAC 06738]|uniref:protein transporter Sec31 n=1 Tax=Streptomyces sp. WAC 06738 TaxID=2203210 RepID=UPI000F7B36B5|nr:protein transporter Sec31 [Streptomyces sp. WAC 06738]